MKPPSMAVVVTAAIVVLVGCQRDPGVATDVSTTTVASSTSTTAPPTTAPPTTASATTSPPTTAPATTAPSTTAPPPTTAAPATTATSEVAPPTTESIAAGELLLSEDGLGTAAFGDSPDAVIGYLSSILGSNTADTGWVSSGDIGNCPGTQARRVEWGSLAVLFADQSDVATNEQHFMGWVYGRVDRLGDEPVGLRTAAGVTLESSIADVQAAYPDVVLNEGVVESDFPPTFYVSDDLVGITSGVEPDSFVIVMYGGPGCGI